MSIITRDRDDIIITRDRDEKYIINYDDINITYNITGIKEKKTIDDITITYINAKNNMTATLNGFQKKQLLTKVLENETFTDLQTEIGDNDLNSFGGGLLGRLKKKISGEPVTAADLERKRDEREKKRKEENANAMEEALRLETKLKNLLVYDYNTRIIAVQYAADENKKLQKQQQQEQETAAKKIQAAFRKQQQIKNCKVKGDEWLSFRKIKNPDEKEIWKKQNSTFFDAAVKECIKLQENTEYEFGLPRNSSLAEEAMLRSGGKRKKRKRKTKRKRKRKRKTKRKKRRRKTKKSNKRRRRRKTRK